MNIISHGIDIVDVRYIQELVEQMGECFEQQYLTDAELNTSGLRTNRLEYLASRLAAKKAVLQALGRDCKQPISWLEIEIQRLPTGEPSVALYATALEVAAKRGITKWLLSISHTPFYATASVIAQRAVAKSVVINKFDLK
ncbi:MAG: holo-[acyl-carrier-protein] synthase [Moorea sp. SIO2I5]|nr:holo-[acyl-carrier-protein] synthase [Moorena sp. SIO2I5]